jgi:hypothetical protein
MTGNYLKRIQELVQSLRAMPNIVVKKSEISPPATPEQIGTAKWSAEMKLPQGVEAFYTELNGFSLEWEFAGSTAEGEMPDTGSVDLLPIEKIFGNWKETIWFDDFEGGDRFKAVKPFDFFQPEACMAFYKDLDKAPQDKVYFHYLGEGLSPTDYSFPEYIDRLIAARGYFYWHSTLCADAQRNPEVKKFHERMSILFPDYSANLFVPRTLPKK